MPWKVEEYDGLELIESHTVPGNLTPKEMSQILIQLAARHLTAEEIISANLRAKMRGKTTILEVNNCNGVLQVGENPFLTAQKVEG
jgi:hypothetical protein